MRAVPVLVALLLVPFVGAVPVLDDDAGSGQDAPNTATATISITPGSVYSGAFSSPFDVDFYAFPASNGQSLDALMWPSSGCLAFYMPSGHLRASKCTAGGPPDVSATANATGTWFVRISPPVPSVEAYRFSVGVNGDPAEPAPVTSPLAEPRFIQPGERVERGGAACTLNFAYNGTGTKAGRVFIGTAAHCFTALGQSVSFLGETFGAVVYLGDYDGINTGEFENGIPGTQTDFALIEVDSDYYSLVKGTVKGRPGLPTALKAHNTVGFGSRFDFSGYGVGFDLSKPTREMRSGIYTLNMGKDWSGIAPISPGDSGGPVLHSDGKAVGVVTHTGAFGAGGPWLDTALGEAAAQGWTVALRPSY